MHNLTATGTALDAQRDSDERLRRDCLELALQSAVIPNKTFTALAEEYFDFIKGAGKGPEPRIKFRSIMNGENLGEYLVLRDRYDIGEVNALGLTPGEAMIYAGMTSNRKHFDPGQGMTTSGPPPDPDPQDASAACVEPTKKGISVCVSHAHHTSQSARFAHSVTVGFPTEAEADAFGKAMMCK